MSASGLWSVGSWLSAALDDPSVCDAMKADIREWFDGGGHFRPASAMTPPSAKDYAAGIVRALFEGRISPAGNPLGRRALTGPEFASLIALAYDAGVLAQQRFTETPKG